MQWIPITDIKQIPDKVVIAWDSVHETAGTYEKDGFFSSFTGNYSFDSGADNMLIRGNRFYSYCNKRLLCGKITYYMRLPGKPIKK